LRTIAVFLFFLVNFLLTWLCVYRKETGWRSAFILSFLYIGVFVWGLTEILGFFKALGFTGILCGWTGYGIVLLVVFVFSRKKRKMQIEKLRPLSFCWEYCALGIILCITFFVAAAYPPNNWDSMTYHLPRIEHWLQNKSLAHYYTSNIRQTLSAPFAEMLILQGRALSGDDFLMNLVQWFSFLGSIIGVSRIAAHLGLNRKGQTAAALFFATVPMAILQASSTQTDLVESFCIVCLVERFFVWRKTGAFREAIDFGIALGLAVLAKGTAYPVAFPFVLYFAIISIRHFRDRFPGACSAALACLMLNLPHYIRNYNFFSDPIGIHPGTISNFSFKSFVITFLAGINSNIAVPLSYSMRLRLENLLGKLWIVLGVDKTTFPLGFPEITGIRYLFRFYEDDAINFFHIILIIVAFVLVFRGAKRKEYALAVIGSWCMFAFFISWQPYITRLQLPLFALSASVFSFALEKTSYVKFRNYSLLLLACFSLLPLLLNKNRPLLPVFQKANPQITNEEIIWNTPREKIMFSSKNRQPDRDNMFENYMNACAAIVQMKPDTIGLVIGGDAWEYPLWSYIRKNMRNNRPDIKHVKTDSVDRNINVLFVLESDVSPFIGAVEDNLVNISNPYVLRRSAEDRSKWEAVIVPPQTSK
jgi:hypothetical protein